MALIPPNGHRKQYVIRIRNYEGRKIPSDRDKDISLRINKCGERLVTAKMNGDDPPGDLAGWIANTGNSLANRLIKLGLIPARQRHPHTPLCDWVDAWVKVVRGRKPESERHAEQ